MISSRVDIITEVLSSRGIVVGLRVIEENFQQLAPETGADQPPRIAIGKNVRTDMLRQPHHIAVIENCS